MAHAVPQFRAIAANAGKPRRETLNGREYLVVPASMIVPGVLDGSKGPLLYPDDEVARNPDGWNGFPVTVFHPTDNGKHVSARSTRVAERHGVGTIWQAAYNDKLTSEAWVDVLLGRAAEQRFGVNFLDDLEAGLPVELSTGLFTEDEPAPPDARHTDGRPYKYIARNYRPDHLAILPGGQRGACSVRDGCGLNVNAGDDSTLCSECGGEIANGVCKECGHEMKQSAAANEERRTLWQRLGDLLGINGGPATNDGRYGNVQSTATGRFKRFGAGTGKGPVHEAAQRGAIVLLDEDVMRGRMAREELAATGANPASWVADEGTWERAKGEADKGGYGEDTYWAVVSHIYRKMGGEVKTPTADDEATGNANPEGCNQYKDCGGGDGVKGRAGIHVSKESQDQQVKSSGFYVGEGGALLAHPDHLDKAKETVQQLRAEIAKSEAVAKNPETKPYRRKITEANIRQAYKDLAHMEKQIENPTSNALRECFSTNGGDEMKLNESQRKEIVAFLTTNCDCWKGAGDAEVLNKLPDEKLAALKKSAEDRKVLVLAANGLREIAAAAGAPATLAVNEMPAFIKDKIAAKEGGEEDEEEDEEEEEEYAMKGNKRKAAAATANDGKPRWRNAQEWQADPNSAPPDVKRMVANAARLEQREREQLNRRLRTIAANSGKKRGEMIENRIKANLPLGELEELLELVGGDAPAANGNGFARPREERAASYVGAGVENHQGDGDGSEEMLDLPTMNWDQDDKRD